MCRHLIMKKPSTAGPGLTRCGYSIPMNQFRIRNRYQTNIDEVNCKQCLKMASIPYQGGRRSRAGGKVARYINGRRVPHSSIAAFLEGRRPVKNFDGPPPGAPYPWEVG